MVNMNNILFPGGLKHARTRRIIAVITTAIVGAELSFRIISSLFSTNLLGITTDGVAIGPIKLRMILGIILMLSAIWINNKAKGL